MFFVEDVFVDNLLLIDDLSKSLAFGNHVLDKEMNLLVSDIDWFAAVLLFILLGGDPGFYYESWSFSLEVVSSDALEDTH